MAAAQAAQSGYALRGLSLGAVLLTARAITLSGQSIPLSWWSPVVYLWQDALVALLFVLIDGLVRRPRLSWLLYGLSVGYIALNVPVTRVLSTPLTWTILRAARGPLADAVLHYVTPANLAALTIPVAVGILAPVVLSRRRLRLPSGVAAGCAIGLVVVGPFAASRVDTRGAHRNAFGALVATSMSRLAAAGADADWRKSPIGGGRADRDLTDLAGTMRGRNVVLIILESTGARHLGLYGATPDPMPNLTALAAQSLIFDRAYAVYPESVKGLFAALCSKYPAFDTAPELYADVPCASIAGSLSAAGYRSALFHSGRFMYLGMSSVIERRGFQLLEDAGAIGGRVDSSFGVDDSSTVQRVLQWIDSQDKSAPFFVAYLPTSGHNPYLTTTSGPFRADQDFWRYMNALHEGDAALGALIAGLRARRLDERTLFVVFGDHGEAFGEHPGNFAHTLFIHEENVHVPLVIAAPGALSASTHIGRVASVVDVAPTMLDLLGLPGEASHQGTTLLGPEPRMALFYTDYSIGWLGLADGCWKYLYELDARRSRLFDVCTDPGETRDRAADLSGRADAYRARVVAWAAAQKDRIARRQ